MTQASLLKCVHVHNKMHMAGAWTCILRRALLSVGAGPAATVDGRQQFKKGCPFSSAFRPTSAFQLKSSKGLSQTLEPQLRSCATLAGACQTCSRAWNHPTRHSCTGVCSQVLCLPLDLCSARVPVRHC